MKVEGNFHIRTQKWATRDAKVSLGGFGSIKEGRLSSSLSRCSPVQCSTVISKSWSHPSSVALLTSQQGQASRASTLELGIFVYVWLVATLKWYADLSLQYGRVLNYYPTWSSIPRNEGALWLMNNASSNPLLAAILECLVFEMLAITVVFL